MTDIKALKASHHILDVLGGYVQLEEHHGEWFGLCPLHKETNPSFHVTPDNGLWFCFGCGEGGDVLEFIQLYYGQSLPEACKTLEHGEHSSKHAESRPARTPKPEWVSEMPPAGISPSSFSLDGAGTLTHKYTYNAPDGKPMGYVCRYQDSGGKKTFRQWTYGRRQGEPDAYWGVQHFSKPRPLYRLDVLAKHPSTPAIIVEGEKAAEAASILFPSHVAMTWPGGANGVRVADWSPLYGRSITIIPDHDAPGREAAEYIAALLSSHGSPVTIVDPEPTRPDGWDIADGLEEKWTSVTALAWAKRQKRGYVPPVPGKAVAPVLSIVSKDTTPSIGDPEEAVPPAFSDHAMALRFIVLHGRDWRYINEWGLWLHWDGIYWKPDRTSLIMSVVQKVCLDTVNVEDGALLPESARKTIASYRTSSSICKTLQYDQTISILSSNFNVDPWVLATPAGVVDLKTGVLSEPDRSHMQTQCTSVSPGGECPRWQAFLLESMDGDVEMVDYLQRLAGYCLTGVTTEEMLGFCYGTGANGKSVMLRTLHYVMGEYAATSSMDIFSDNEAGQHKNVLARLDKKRLVLASETEEGKRWSEGRIKNFTSGEMIQANFMRQNEFEFKFVGKLVFSGNHKPSLRSVDKSIRRRVQIIPFTVTVEEDRRDRSLEEKLKPEGPGILAWMIAGCLEWQKIGLCIPQRVMDATDEYMTDEDALREWIDQRCEIGPAEHVTSSTLYKNYLSWCEANDEHFPWSKKRLGASLLQRGYERARFGGSGERGFRGIGLKPMSF